MDGICRPCSRAIQNFQMRKQKEQTVPTAKIVAPGTNKALFRIKALSSRRQGTRTTLTVRLTLLGISDTLRPGPPAKFMGFSSQNETSVNGKVYK